MPFTTPCTLTQPRPQRLQLVAIWLGLAAAYALLAKAGLLLAFVGANVSPIWPPSGLALAAIIIGGWRLAPGVALGTLIGNWEGMPALHALAVTVGNTSEALIAALLFRALGGQPCFTQVRSVRAFLIALMIGAATAATIGVGALAMAGQPPPQATISAWCTWLSGDATGMLLVTPTLLMLERFRQGAGHAAEASWPEAVALLFAGTLLALCCFHGGTTSPEALSLAFLTFPITAWMTLRFGLTGGSVLVTIMGTIAIIATSNHQGPFAGFADLNQRLMAVQALLTGLSITSLILAAIMAERQAAEGQLRLSAAAVAKAHDLILWIDDHNCLVHANPAAFTRLGRQPAELIGRPMTDIADDPGSGSWRHSHAMTAMQESSLIAADGTRIPVEVSFARVQDPTLPGHFTCAIARDLTERKAMGRQIDQMAKMESLGRLAGGIAHDFNNVLAVTIGYAETSLRRTDLPEPVRAALQHIRTAGEQAAGMTRQLLAFSRQQVLAPRRHDLAALVHDSVPLLERLIGRHITIHLDIPSSTFPVLVDATQVQQLLMNLAANARDAMPSGGTLSIRVEQITLALDHARDLLAHNRHDAQRIRAGTFVRLTVADSGEGMPPAVREHLFEPFFTTKGPGQGTGLGLSSVHGIVVQSGGFIAVESIPGTGTRFAIHLPPSAGDTHPATQIFLRPQTRLLRVLVVDDQPAVRDLVAQELTEAGHIVLSCADATAALAQAKATALDVLVTDVVMPGMDGRSLADTLRLQYPQLAVVLMSGFPRGHLDERLPDRTHFIAKPFKREALLNAVTDALSDASDTRPG